MKKGVFVLTAAIILGTMLGFSYENKEGNQQQELGNQQELDSLSVLYKSLGLKNMDTEETTMLVYFNSKCDHCEHEMEDISANGELFMGTKMVFVSSEPERTAVEFLSQYNLEVLYEKTKSTDIHNTFTGGVPQIFIYEKGMLKQHFMGRTDVEILASYLD